MMISEKKILQYISIVKVEINLMKDILFLLLIFISANGVRPETIPMYDFGFSKIPACTGDSFTLKWTGYHNLHEVEGPSCNSASISHIHGFEFSGYEETFTNLGAAPGETRYFKCDLHCGSSASRIEVICCDGRDAPQCNDDVCTWDGSTCCFAQQLNSTTNTCPGSEGVQEGATLEVQQPALVLRQSPIAHPNVHGMVLLAAMRPLRVHAQIHLEVQQPHALTSQQIIIVQQDVIGMDLLAVMNYNKMVHAQTQP